jgi:hypothetical protein
LNFAVGEVTQTTEHIRTLSRVENQADVTQHPAGTGEFYFLLVVIVPKQILRLFVIFLRFY